MTRLRMPRPYLGIILTFVVAGASVAGVPPKRDLKPTDPCKDVVKKAGKKGSKNSSRTASTKITRREPASDPIVLSVANDSVVPSGAIAILTVRTKKDPCS